MDVQQKLNELLRMTCPEAREELIKIGEQDLPLFKELAKSDALYEMLLSEGKK